MRRQSLVSKTLPSFALVLDVLPALPPLALVSHRITDHAPFSLLLPGLITTLVLDGLTDLIPFLKPLPANHRLVSKRITDIALFSARLLSINKALRGFCFG